MQNWDRLVGEYLDQCQTQGLAASTLLERQRELDRLGCWLKNRRPRPHLSDVNAELLIDYLRSRTAYKAKATVSAVMSRVRSFGEFLLQRGAWLNNPLRWMRGPKIRADQRVPRRIPGPSLQAMWQGVATWRHEYHRYLWLATMSLLYGTGLRRGELERLDLTDWSSAEGTLKIDGRKTGQERQVAVPELAHRCLEAYLPRRQNRLEALGLTSETSLFIDKNGGRLSGTAISSAVRRIGRRSGIESLTLHQFRHSCASDLLENGVKLPEVQRMLGHQTITTTVRYLHIADPRRHEAVKLHPINQILAPAAGGQANPRTTPGGQA